MSIDTGDRMVRDCGVSPGFATLERLTNRIDRALTVWAEWLVKYGRHTRSCPEGLSGLAGICNCGFLEAKRAAKLLCKVDP